MKKMLESLREASRQAIEEAVDMDSLEALRVRYLGKKGELTAILKQMGKLSAEERPVIGQLANEVRSELENEIESRKSALAARLQEAKLRAETLDVTMPGKEISLGKKHVMNTVLDEIDATHSPMFHQIEGLVIDKGITMGDLKGTLNTLMKKLYGPDTVTRFRPHHFPFTEPSCEMDVQCFECHGKGCRVCKGEGWIELLGAGMVHPRVLEMSGIDPTVYSGFAFGVGLERLVMRRFQISDMRLLYENDTRFLSQF